MRPGHRRQLGAVEALHSWAVMVHGQDAHEYRLTNEPFRGWHFPHSFRLSRCFRTPISIDVVSATRDSRELKDLAALGLCLLAEPPYSSQILEYQASSQHSTQHTARKARISLPPWTATEEGKHITSVQLHWTTRNATRHDCFPSRGSPSGCCQQSRLQRPTQRRIDLLACNRLTEYAQTPRLSARGPIWHRSRAVLPAGQRPRTESSSSTWRRRQLSRKISS